MMKFVTIVALSLFLTQGDSLVRHPSLYQSGEDSASKDGQEVFDMKCLYDNCASAYQTCLSYTRCSLLLSCVSKCMDGFEGDTSPMKTTTQSCVNTCTFTYADMFYVGLSRCLSDNKCITLPPIPSTCKYPGGITRSRKFQLSDLKGGWWVVKGYNRAYDCIACKHTFFDAKEYETNEFYYRPTFEVLTPNGSFIFINGTVYVELDNTQPGEAIDLDYYLYGFPVHMTWHALDGAADNSSLLVYYCGNMLEWNIEGAMILSRSPILSPGDDGKFAQMVKKNTVLDYEEFCNPHLSPCPN